MLPENMAIENIVSAAFELIILLNCILDLQRIVASEESYILPILFAVYHFQIKPFAEYRESVTYNGPPAVLLGL